jgi:hypothetical protein
VNSHAAAGTGGRTVLLLHACPKIDQIRKNAKSGQDPANVAKCAGPIAWWQFKNSTRPCLILPISAGLDYLSLYLSIS